MPYLARLYLLLVYIGLSVCVCGQNLNFQYLTVKDGLPQSTIRSIVKDKYGFMWFGTWNGVARYDGYHFKVYRNVFNDSTSINNNRIHYIYKDENEMLWISTFDNSQICRYNYELDNFIRFDKQQLSKSVKDSLNHLKNLEVIQGLFPFLQKNIGTFSLSPTREHIVFSSYVGNRLKDDNVNCVYKDDNSLLWIGTTTAGVGKADLNAKKFKYINIATLGRYSGNVPARSLLADSCQIWIGTNDKGLLVFDREKQKLTQAPIQIPGKSVITLFRDASENIWIGGRTSLTIFNPKNKVSKSFQNKIRGTNIFSRFFAVAEDPVSGEFWLCAYDGIYKFNLREERFIYQKLDSFFDIPGAGCLFFDSKKNLWLGTEYGGLLFFPRIADNGVLGTPIAIASNGTNRILPDNRVYSIAEDKYGQIWVGTAGGLCKINSDLKISEKFSIAEGLSDQYITKVLPDKYGNIWVAHKKGLSKITAQNSTVRNYARANGINDYEFTDASGSSLAETGELFFGGIDGVVFFNPQDIVDNPIKPKVLLTQMQVLNRTIKVGEEINGTQILPKALYLTQTITLPYNLRNFTMNFSAMQYTNPERNRYAYILEGMDNEWIYTDASNRTATYANLNPGKYLFKVKASNDDGVWNDIPTTLKVIVLPPWWKTVWAYSLYIVFILSGILFLYRLIRTRAQYNHRIMSERLKAEKSQELEQMRSQFFTNVSHEFRTPLTLIVDPLERLVQGSVPSGKVSAYYEIMYRNSLRLLGLINQLLDFRKLEESNLKLHIVHEDVILFIKNIVAAFEFQAEQRQIKIIFSSEIESLIIGFDRDVVEKIVYNLLSNALKFTSEKGEIGIKIKWLQDKESFFLSVTDNGPGIPGNYLDKIFEPFYQIDQDFTKNRNKGTGVGLALVKDLVILHGGSVDVTSDPGKETCFSVIIKSMKRENLPELIPIDSSSTLEVAHQLDPIDSSQIEASQEIPLIIIVEDNDDLRNYLSGLFSQMFRILTAEDGEEGLSITTKAIPDLVISDVMMPKFDGLQLCKTLKSQESTSHIPVILLTARQSEQYQIEGFETGADAYVGKPFSSKLLIAQVKNLLDSRKKLRALFDKSSGFDTRIIGVNAIDKAFLNKLTTLIEENLTCETVNVEWLASKIFMSRTQLYRKVKAISGQSVTEFITTIRLRKAAQLLVEQDLPLNEIAYLVGYADASSFGRIFLKQYGTTPRKYRAQH